MGWAKLILFDIDGTLITPGPIPRQALGEAISYFLKRKVELTFHEVAGLTDPIIIRNALVRYGVDPTPTSGDIKGVLEHFLNLVEDRLHDCDDVQIFPGAEALVRACRSESWVPALLTGNVERGARAKLTRTGLWELFAFGIYGDDGNTREDLPWIAREQAWEVLNESIPPADTILVGDTPNDARIARLNRIKSLIVCRRQEAEWRQAIEAEQPTWIVEGFDDIPALIQLMREA